MKTSKTFVILFILAVFSYSCILEPNHSVRIQNNYSETVTGIRIGTTQYGDVRSGSITEYLPVDEGNSEVSGYTQSGYPVYGTVTINGYGTHNWTLTILQNGSFEIEQD